VVWRSCAGCTDKSHAGGEGHDLFLQMDVLSGETGLVEALELDRLRRGIARRAVC